jgi:hypothetical protein
MDKKYLGQVITLLLMVLILVIPGIFSVGLISHEFYHYYKHSDYSQAFCFTVNDVETHAFVMVNSSAKIDQFDYNLEEKRANQFSTTITMIYTIISLMTIIWVVLIIVENKKSKGN